MLHLEVRPSVEVVVVEGILISAEGGGGGENGILLGESVKMTIEGTLIKKVV